VSIHQDAHVVVFIADYIGVDAASKINAIGAGFAISGLQPTGMVAPQHIAVLVDVPSRYAGSEFAVSVELRNETIGGVVQLLGASGAPEALRVQQMAKAEPPVIPGVYLPELMFCRVQMMLAFPNGLPLAPGLYAWRVELDGQTSPGWHASFYVPGPPPQPVFGGPAGPSDIPMLPTTDDPSSEG